MHKFFKGFEGGTTARRIKRTLNRAYDPYLDEIRLAAQLRNAHASHLAQQVTSTAETLFLHLFRNHGISSSIMRQIFDHSKFTMRQLYENIMIVMSTDHFTLTRLRARLGPPHAQDGNHQVLTKWGRETEELVKHGLVNLPAAPDLGSDAWVQNADLARLMKCFTVQALRLIEIDGQFEREMGLAADNERVEKLKNDTLEEREKIADDAVDRMINAETLGGVLGALLGLRDEVNLGGLAHLPHKLWEDQLLDEITEKATVLWATTGISKFTKAFEHLFTSAIHRARRTDPTIQKPTKRQNKLIMKQASGFILDLKVAGDETEDDVEDEGVEAIYAEAAIFDALTHLRVAAAGVPDGVIVAAAEVIGEVATTLRKHLSRWKTFPPNMSLRTLLCDLGQKSTAQDREGADSSQAKVVLHSHQAATFALLAGLLGALEQGCPLPAECRTASTLTLLPIVGTVYIRDFRAEWTHNMFLFKTAPDVFRASWSHFLRASHGALGDDGSTPAQFMPFSLLRAQFTKRFDDVGFKRMLILRNFHLDRVGAVAGNGLVNRHEEYEKIFATVNPLRPILSMQWIGRDLHSERCLNRVVDPKHP